MAGNFNGPEGNSFMFPAGGEFKAVKSSGDVLKGGKWNAPKQSTQKKFFNEAQLQFSKNEIIFRKIGVNFTI